MKKLILMTILVALMAAPAMANPSFGDGGAGLQTVLDNITVSGPSSVTAFTDALSDLSDSYWAIDGSGGSATTMVIEVAAWSAGNKFGIFDTTNSANRYELFAGADSAGDQAFLSVKIDGSIWVDNIDTTVDFGGTTFGYYLDSREAVRDYNAANNTSWVGGLWYSDTALNGDDADHMAAYQGTGDNIQLTGLPAGEWTENMYLLGFEDLDDQHWANGASPWSASEPDFTDMVVMIESISPTIPAPGAMILGSIGVSFVGWLRRRRSL